VLNPRQATQRIRRHKSGSEEESLHHSITPSLHQFLSADIQITPDPALAGSVGGRDLLTDACQLLRQLRIQFLRQILFPIIRFHRRRRRGPSGVLSSRTLLTLIRTIGGAICRSQGSLWMPKAILLPAWPDRARSVSTRRTVLRRSSYVCLQAGQWRALPPAPPGTV